MFEHDIFKSKKAVMAILASLITLYCVERGIPLDKIFFIVGPMAAYLPIQGVVDHGKNFAPQIAPRPAATPSSTPKEEIK